jgi:hypothetical protein
MFACSRWPIPPPVSLCQVFLSMQLDHLHCWELLHCLPHQWRGKNRWTHFSLTVRVTSR